MPEKVILIYGGTEDGASLERGRALKASLREAGFDSQIVRISEHLLQSLRAIAPDAAILLGDPLPYNNFAEVIQELTLGASRAPTLVMGENQVTRTGFRNTADVAELARTGLLADVYLDAETSNDKIIQIVRRLTNH